MHPSGILPVAALLELRCFVCVLLFKILPFGEGALMSVSDFSIQTPRVLFSMRTYEFLKTHVLACHHWQ